MENQMNKISELKGAIIKVIAFFDLFDYPLTANEIRLNLSVECQLSEVMEALENNPPDPLYQGGAAQGGIIESKNGFYFLAGRGKNIAERLSRYNFTDRKFKRARLVSKIFKFIPWIKMMAAGNLLGAHNLKDLSDIDFFIVAEDKRLWLARFFSAGLAKLLGLRPRAGNQRDKICLSFYASDRAMDLSGLMLKQKNLDSRLRGNDKGGSGDDGDNDDIYFIYWLAGLTPLYDAGGVYEKFMAANSWLKNYLPNWPVGAFASAGKQAGFWSRRRDAGRAPGEFYREAVNLFIGGLEPQFKALQLSLLPPRLKNLMNQDSRVVVNDQIIKLHANDRREEYRGKYEEKIGNLSLRA